LLLTPFVPRAFLQDTAFEAFEIMTGALMRQVSRLMPEIDANDTYLLKMQDNLFLLQELLSSERSAIAAAKSATLGGFWTKAGGNGKKIRSLEYSLGLLADLKAIGEDAAACTIAALIF